MTNISYMFQNCTSIETINLSTSSAPKLTTATYLFNGCTNLKNVNLNGADLSHITSAQA